MLEKQQLNSLKNNNFISFINFTVMNKTGNYPELVFSYFVALPINLQNIFSNLN